LNCAKGPTPEPCGECDSCKEIAAGTSLDVIEIDAASNRGIDQIRELREMVRYAPAAARHKIVILDEAHMLTGEASNALLKTLEEPPERVIFVMATTQPEDLEDTIRSRSQHFHFRALTFLEITNRLQYIAKQEKLKIDEGALSVIARMAEGSMRDALSLLEQARAYCGDEIRDKELRELLGVVPEDALNELVEASDAVGGPRTGAGAHTPEGRTQLAAFLPGSDQAPEESADRAGVWSGLGFDCGDAGAETRIGEGCRALQRRGPDALLPDSAADG
jgi:DNA polymerase-3 subunit gamma/tau